MNKFISIIFFSILATFTYAERPMRFVGNYTGEKIWNTQRMVPFGGSVSLEIDDTLAFIKYPSSEKVDTFIYRDNFNNGFRYTRKSKYRMEYIIISRDSTKLQIGEPMEINYFYKLMDTGILRQTHMGVESLPAEEDRLHRIRP